METNKTTITLVRVPVEEAITGKRYITNMKHGWIEGEWDANDQTCYGYYWRDMEWYPYELYEIVERDI